MTLPRRMLYGTIVHVDANCINARQLDLAMNQLERWRHDKVILMQMAEISQDEARRGRSPARSRKALGYIYSMTLAQTSEEQGRLQLIESILFPSGCKSQSERNDTEIVFNAGKYNAILVTRDGNSKSQPGGILGNRDRLWMELQIHVMTPEEAVPVIREKIARRDALARAASAQTGEPLPEWVGKD